ncbi:hypothetical protein AB6A40_011162 [Gnathostoma spinigerum]|uniref:Uncharacterized protein n=1 Tax=Gnathostoma spinigerum TaxID=75299 RepID=A0ABD6EXF4_9BILA
MAYIFDGKLLGQMATNIKRVQYLWMDDWYVTHALMNGTNARFIDIGRHFLSINSEEQFFAIANDTLALRKNLFIFGHFRPPQSFDMDRREKIWRMISSVSS